MSYNLLCFNSQPTVLFYYSSYYNPSKTYEDMTECELALEKFAQSSSNYTLCTIRNSQPIRACELCVDSYMDVKAAHENILTSEINGTKCKDKLINLDRLEIIESTFRGIKDIWYRGFCDSKYFLFFNLLLY